MDNKSPIFRDWNSDLLYFEEKTSNYRPGGRHPTCLGDKLSQDRYQIEHKLGYGFSSTVWMARDEKLQKWVAIKIRKADVSDQDRSVPVIQAIQGTEASTYVVELLDSFVHLGPNGSHQCLVFELLGPTLDKVMRKISDDGTSSDRFDPDNILRITKMLLQAVASLHKAGYFHGVISTLNVVFTSSELLSGTEIDYTTSYLAHMSREEIMYIMGAPEFQECARLDGKPLDAGMPKQVVASAKWEEWIEEDNEGIKLINLWDARAHSLESYSPSHSSSQIIDRETPEAIFTDKLDYRVDLFRTGCVIYAMLFAEYPFPIFRNICDAISQMINFVEELPIEWTSKYMHLKEACGETNLPDTYNKPDDLKRKFDERIQDPNLKKLFPLLRGLMRFRPADRMEASEALELVDSIIESFEAMECNEPDSEMPFVGTQ